MELHHEFAVPVPVEEAWRVLLDIERVAPCMPGATVDGFDGTTVTGRVKVKVGPVTITYRGTAVFDEQDDAAHRMVLIASGRETRGQGTARATVTGTLTGREGTTTVSVRTELTVTGRPAQFGRGVMADVGDRVIGQFADCLARQLDASGGGAGGSGEASTGVGDADGKSGKSGESDESDESDDKTVPESGAASGTRTPPPADATTATTVPTTDAATAKPYARPPDVPEAEPLDLLGVAGLPVAKRAAGPALLAAAVALFVVLARRRRRR